MKQEVGGILGKLKGTKHCVEQSLEWDHENSMIIKRIRKLEEEKEELIKFNKRIQNDLNRAEELLIEIRRRHDDYTT